MSIKQIARSLGVYIYLKSFKIRLSERINRKKTRELQTRERMFYSRLIKPGDLCFDIGANSGDKTSIFLSLGARVIAIEPQPDCVKRILRRFKNNSKLQVLGVGISDKPGTGLLTVSNKTDTISTMSDNWKTSGRFTGSYIDSRTIEVRVITLDEVIKTYGIPDYIKIDVEGYEERVLMGLSEPVKLLSFEFVMEFIDEAEQCICLLGKLGNISLNVIIGTECRFRFEDFLSGEEFIKRLRENSGSDSCGDIFVRFT